MFSFSRQQCKLHNKEITPILFATDDEPDLPVAAASDVAFVL